MNSDLLRWLRCPGCGGALALTGAAPEHGEGLHCERCGRTHAVVRGIPRFVDAPRDGAGERTQASFGYEWTHFNDWRPSGDVNFQDYFETTDLGSLRDAVVLDAGCGMGRHARQIAPFVSKVIAIDFSRAIEQAARNTADAGNVDCVQGDLLALPLADESFDFVYSLGVLHHLDDTAGALRGLVAKLRPGGRLRVYLYWKRHGWRGGLLRMATAARVVSTRLPLPVLRAGCYALSIALSACVITPYRIAAALGVKLADDWPLVVYAKYPFTVLYNDQFDRFSAPIEKRYDADEVRALLETAGLRAVRVQPRFGWIAEGVKAGT
jgi:SAM-dependent methyltransferase